MTFSSQIFVVGEQVRLTPEGDAWRAHDFRQKTSARLSRQAAAVLVSFGTPSSVEQIASSLAQVDIDEEQIARTVDRFVKYGWLIDAKAESAQEIDWSEHGWDAAWEHHMATFDYPYEDYLHEGRSSDIGVMEDYYSESPDQDRFSTGEGARESLPRITDALARFSSPWGHSGPAGKDVKRAHLLDIASAAFLPLSVRENKDPRAAAAYHKTSPSGGARHPVEGYLWTADIPGADAQLEHVVAGEGVMRLLSKGDVWADTSRFQASHLADFDVRAVFLLSVVPSRNMYRYREPRTLRTIYMDASHVAATVELLARSRGLSAFGHHGFYFAQIEEAAGMKNHLQESFVYGVAIGDGRR